MDSKITFVVDGESKKEFSDLCDSLGLTMSSALLIFVRQCVIKKGIPFNVDLSSAGKDIKKTPPKKT